MYFRVWTMLKMSEKRRIEFNLLNQSKHPQSSMLNDKLQLKIETQLILQFRFICKSFDGFEMSSKDPSLRTVVFSPFIWYLCVIYGFILKMFRDYHLWWYWLAFHCDYFPWKMDIKLGKMVNVHEMLWNEHEYWSKL